jgi:hypothetical protein
MSSRACQSFARNEKSCLRNPSRACQKGGLHGRIEAIRSWSIEPYLPQLIGTTRPAAETGGCSTRLGFHAVPVWSVANAAARGGPAFRERPLSLNVLWIVASAGWCLAGLSWSKHLPTGRTGAAVELPSGKVGPTPTGAARQIVRPSGRFLRTALLSDRRPFLTQPHALSEFRPRLRIVRSHHRVVRREPPM